MRAWQSLRMALDAVLANKLRSFLTMLGIIIGVVALVVLVSLVTSTSDAVTAQVQALGTDMLSASILNDQENPIKLSELSDIAQLPEIFAVAPLAQFSATAKVQHEEESMTVYGTTAAYAQIQGLELAYGRFLKTADVENSSYVAVLSDAAADELFGRSDVTGQSLSLDGRSFQIVGVLEEDDSMLSALMSGLGVYVPYTVAERLSATAGSVTRLYASSADADGLDQAEEALDDWLLHRLKMEEDAYLLINQSGVMDALGTINDTLAYLLGGIAAISLLVGGIGIMNIMLVSVTERTREIGIRKAIGAGRGSILLQFLAEALLISLAGCMIGLLCSYLLLAAISYAARGLELVFTMAPGVAGLAVGFSIAIGVLFGIYPAYKAASKQPIEALHYEG